TCGDPANPFQNCGFETGDFTSWVTQDVAAPFVPLHVGGAGETPGFGFFTSRPTEGTKAALHGFDGSGPGHIRVAQDVALPAGSTTSFTLVGGTCHVPAGAKAVMLNVTAVGPTDLGDLRVYPAGQPEPLASTINFRAGATRANNAAIRLGTAGQVSVKVDMP